MIFKQEKYVLVNLHYDFFGKISSLQFENHDYVTVEYIVNWLVGGMVGGDEAHIGNEAYTHQNIIYDYTAVKMSTCWYLIFTRDRINNLVAFQTLDSWVYAAIESQKHISLPHHTGRPNFESFKTIINYSFNIGYW